MIISAE